MNTKEEMELKVFELLEGNLSAEEARAVEALIQRDPHWAREFRLMQLTYLQEAEAEKTVFPHPDKLYRSTATRFLIPRRAYYWTAAAAVTLLAIGFWLRQPAPAVHSPLAAKVESIETQQPVAAKLPAVAQPKPVVKSPVVPVAVNRSKTEPKDSLVPVVSPQPVVKTDAQSIAMETELEGKAIQSLPLAVPAIASAQSMRFIDGKYIPVNQRKSLYFRLMNQGREMLAYVSDPRIRFERMPREGRIDRLRLRIETERIGIIATLIE
jgi:hypothetical protein